MSAGSGLRRGRRPRARRGYTIVEVMMAMAVLTLGVSGVIAMQKATLVSNTNARNLATANSIAQAWVERLRADSQIWTEPGGTANLGSTEWLTGAVNGAPVAGGGWIIPGVSNPLTTKPAGAPGADVMGADLYAGVDPAALAQAFCTQLRLTRFSTQRSNGGAADVKSFYPVIRVEVRVIWDRRGAPLTCIGLPNGFETQVGTYGVTYLVSSVLENSSPI